MTPIAPARASARPSGARRVGSAPEPATGAASPAAGWAACRRRSAAIRRNAAHQQAADPGQQIAGDGEPLGAEGEVDAVALRRDPPAVRVSIHRRRLAEIVLATVALVAGRLPSRGVGLLEHQPGGSRPAPGAPTSPPPAARRAALTARVRPVPPRAGDGSRRRCAQSQVIGPGEPVAGRAEADRSRGQRQLSARPHPQGAAGVELADRSHERHLRAGRPPARTESAPQPVEKRPGPPRGGEVHAGHVELSPPRPRVPRGGRRPRAARTRGPRSGASEPLSGRGNTTRPSAATGSSNGSTPGALRRTRVGKR